MIKSNDRRAIRRKRKSRIRGKVSGTAQRPRFTVFKSLRHVYAQLIDDNDGRTLASAATIEKTLRGSLNNASNQEAAKQVGKLIAERAQEKDIKKVVFDRAGYRYHGVIKSIAEAAREGGLEF
ncbi:MAG: 50S ribosomal protein L18 [bacterium]|nr:50S ribosomal protein L18 [bacterium]